MAKPRSVKATLKAARAVIADKKRWTKEYFAVDMNGRPCEENCLDAVKFCALGALQFVDGPFECEAEDLLFNACERLFDLGVADTNDIKGHAAILKAFDRAIKDA